MNNSVYIDAKINSFIARKLATLGDNILNVSPVSGRTQGMYYETIKRAKVQH